MERYEIDSGASSLELSGRSTLHAIKGSSRSVHGIVEMAWNADGTLALDPLPKVHLEVPVSSLGSGNVLVDKQLREIAGSRAFPNIIADLQELRPTGKDDEYAASGEVDVRGTKRQFEGTLNVKRSGSGVALDGSTTIDVRDFGIKPPRILMIEVLPQITIRLRLAAEPE